MKYNMFGAKFGVDEDNFLIELDWNREADPLIGSLQKWAFVTWYISTTGKYLEDEGVNTCTLCERYFFRVERCTLCPVMHKTGEDACTGTPYVDYVSAFSIDEAAAAAENEFAFLFSLAKETEDPDIWGAAIAIDLELQDLLSREVLS